MRTTTYMQGAFLLGVAFLCGCHKGDTKDDPNAGGKGAGLVATANIEGRSGSGMTGNATFTQHDKGSKKVLVRVQIQGAPAGQHGVHIHEKGDCSDPEAKNAGGHFNPGNTPHGAPGSGPHHPGDFGNMTVKDDGTGMLELETDVLTVTDGQNSVVGKAIVVHEKADDLATQPSGNSGNRIGCGVVMATSAENPATQKNPDSPSAPPTQSQTPAPQATPAQ